MRTRKWLVRGQSGNPVFLGVSWGYQRQSPPFAAGKEAGEERQLPASGVSRGIPATVPYRSLWEEGRVVLGIPFSSLMFDGWMCTDCLTDWFGVMFLMVMFPALVMVPARWMY